MYVCVYFTYRFIVSGRWVTRFTNLTRGSNTGASNDYGHFYCDPYPFPPHKHFFLCARVHARAFYAVMNSCLHIHFSCELNK